MKQDLFSPYIFIIAIIAYLLMAFIAFNYQIKGLKFPSPFVFFYITIGCISYIAGVLASSYFKLESISKNETKPPSIFEMFLLIIVIVAIILGALNIYNLGGIPLFSGYLKAKAATKIWFISYLLFLPSINLLLAKFKKKSYYGLLSMGVLLFALTGYRTTTVVIILSAFITFYYTRKVSWSHFLIIGCSIFLLTLLIGYIAVKSIEWQHWNLNPLELLFYRAGYTLTVLDRLTQFEGVTNGRLLYYTLTGFLTAHDPRVIIGTTVLGYKHSSTSTIFGPAILDFGVFAMILQMFFIGIVLTSLHKIQKIKKGFFTALYAIILAHTLVWIETGPTDLVVWIFYIIAVLVIIKEVLHENRHRS